MIETSFVTVLVVFIRNKSFCFHLSCLISAAELLHKASYFCQICKVVKLSYDIYSLVIYFYQVSLDLQSDAFTDG